MKSKLRSFIATITAVAIIFAALWATSPAVLLDVMQADNALLVQAQADFNNTQDHVDEHDQNKSGQTCNHGCHVASHLVGLTEINVFTKTPRPIVRLTVSDLSQFIANPSLKGPYRPPLAQPLV